MLSCILNLSTGLQPKYLDDTFDCRERSECPNMTKFNDD